MNPEPKEHEKLVEAVFIALQQKRNLQQQAASREVTVREVGHWLLFPDDFSADEQAESEARIHRAMHNNLNLYGAYRSLAQSRQRCHIPLLAAAASDEDKIVLPGQGATTTISRSKVEHSQFYVVIEFDRISQVESASRMKMIVERDASVVGSLYLPSIRERRCQVVLMEDDPILVALRSGESEVRFI